MSENLENCVENKNNSRYYADVQKKYRQKIKQYGAKFNLSENDAILVEKIEKAIKESGLSGNAWTKLAIYEKLVKDGYIIE